MDAAEDGSSSALYFPLVPQQDSLVEITETEYFNEASRRIPRATEVLFIKPTRSTIMTMRTNRRMTKGICLRDIHLTEVSPAALRGESRLIFSDDCGLGRKKSSRWNRRQRRMDRCTRRLRRSRSPRGMRGIAWVSSPTKLPFQTMWQGYRLPVLCSQKRSPQPSSGSRIISWRNISLDFTLLYACLEVLCLFPITPAGLSPGAGPLPGPMIQVRQRPFLRAHPVRWLPTGYGVTLMVTWFLPIVIVPETWQVHEVPGALQITKGRKSSQPGPSETDNTVPVEHRKEVLSKKRLSTKAFRNPRLTCTKSLTGTGLGGHHHTRVIRRDTTCCRATGILALLSCEPIRNVGTPIRYIPAPALSATPSRITRLECSLHQYWAMQCRRTDTISP